MKNQSIYDAFERLWYHINNKFATKEEVAAGGGSQTIFRDWTSDNAKNLITFFADGYEYDVFLTLQAEEGMTWQEWCDSKYNTYNGDDSRDANFYCNEYGVYGWGYSLIINLDDDYEYIGPDTLITANATYVIFP